MTLFRSSARPSITESYLFPFFALIAIMIADRHVESVLLTPMLSTCLLGVLALRLDTRVLLLWFFILWINVIYSLAVNPGGIPDPNMTGMVLAIRSVSFVVVGVMALAMNRGIKHLRRNHRNLLKMLDQLPCAVVVSDAAGALLFSNRKAATVLKKEPREMIGRSFFSFFSFPELPGKDIETYMHLTDRNVAQETLLAIETPSGESQTARATQIPMELANGRCVVTALDFDGAPAIAKA